MPHPILSTLGDWTAAVAALPADGPLPQRTVLVPSERHAHAIRRELVRRGDAQILAGTRFLAPVTAATTVLEAAGVPFTSGEDALRPARLLASFSDDALQIEHFDVDLLRSTPGWDEAFASAIHDLEAGGFVPADLPRDEALLRDVALLWARVEREAGTSWSAARVQFEAAAILTRDPAAWPFRGPTLAVVTGHESVAAARFLRAIPGVTIAVRAARPVRERDVGRVRALYDAEVAKAIAAGPKVNAAPAHERDLLATYLFERPEVIADARRPRSKGPEGTVHLEEHAGVEAEVEAAADWVARKVLDGVPLEEIAVLVAAQDPLSGLVADRLERLEVNGAPLPVHVAGGLPAISTCAGARVLAAVRAVQSHIVADALAEVLPALRLEGDEDRKHLTHGEGMELAFSLGIAGGNAAHPEGALAWSERAASRVVELEAALARVDADDDDSEGRDAWRLDRTLRNLRAIRPALDALVGVARAVVEDRPLSAVWDALGGFLSRWLLAPGEGAAIPSRLQESLATACKGTLGGALGGFDALEVIEDHLRSMRVSRRRFGEPAVYVGTVASAAGLEFAATRVIGLCEGVLPSVPHESPVLPERLRDTVERAKPGGLLPRAQDRVSAQVQALFAAVLGARRELVLSAPRVDAAGTEREASALFIDAAAAIARPDASTGAPAKPVPNTTALARDCFAPARESAASFSATHPVRESGWLSRAAGPTPLLPPSWSSEPALALARVAEVRRPTGPLGPVDGVLGEGDPFPEVPGLSPGRAISASALKDLLACPHLFLMRRILGWDDPAAAPPLRELDAASFGTLLHRVAERFYRAHGAAFVAGEKNLAHWRKRAFEVADASFDEFLSEYPLIGERVRAKERERLHDSVRELLVYDWNLPGTRRFVDVERGFGWDEPLALKSDGVTLHLHGWIDRLDVDEGVTVVRDLKSGGAHPRRGDEAAPNPGLDVQLGVYALAAKKLALAWGTPKKVAGAYAYAHGRSEVEERSYREDAATLEKSTATWLATAGHILSERAFTSTPVPGDCRYCPFLPLCGDHAPRRALEGLAEADGALGRFRALKLGEEEEE